MLNFVFYFIITQRLFQLSDFLLELFTLTPIAIPVRLNFKVIANARRQQSTQVENNNNTLAPATVWIPAAILIASPRRYTYWQRNLLTRAILFALVSFEQKSFIYKPFQLSICGLQLNFFVCFAPATVNIPVKKFLMETLFTCTPVLQNGGRELKC